MRLLHVHTFEFEQFEVDPPQYAILSHRWSKSEAKLADIERWRSELSSTKYPKVCGFARYVRTHLSDVEWIWIDSCCINQDSASELSEGVNRMFEWYRNAKICFAYLPDVEQPSDRDALRRSIWFTRGWTLQELVASKTVVFLTTDWQVIGHKGPVKRLGESIESGPSLESLLSDVTRIPRAVLQDFGNSNGLSFSEKMLWMAGRQTLKEEDMIYALFGIFGVTPGANYGEGKRNAELRLKEAMRRETEVACTTFDGAPPGPASTILPRGEPNFVERQDVLDLLGARSTRPQAWVALVGIGGVGKTQIALRHVNLLRKSNSDIWILWIFASKATRFDESIRDIAEQIKLPGRQDAKANILQLMQSWLADPVRRWVVVFDNADAADFLLEPPNANNNAVSTKRRIDYFPACGHGLYIMTTRNRSEALKFVAEEEVVDVLPMDTKSARILLQKKLGSLYDEDYGPRLASALDFMPLALSQAASFIKQKRRYTIESYLAELETSRDARTSLLRQHGTLPKRERDESSSIIHTWQISFEYIRESRKSAADLLAFMSFCDRQSIPHFLLHGASESGGDEEVHAPEHGHDEAEFYDDIEMLENFSFISASVGSKSWQMHRLVQDATQWWLQDRQEMAEFQQRYVKRLYVVLPPGDYKHEQTCQMLAPHVQSAMGLQLDGKETSLLWATVMERMVVYKMRQGSLLVANDYAEASLRIRTELFGGDDIATLWAECVLAELHQGRGLLKDAEELQTKVMRTSKTVLGLKHPLTLKSMSGLATTYSFRGRWNEAEALQVEVIGTRKEVLGPAHPHTLASMNNLATIYMDQGRWKQAEELVVEAVDMMKTVLEPEHPDLLESIENLAFLYMHQKRWKEAEELELRVMETRAIVLGPAHSETLISTDYLATIYSNQGRWGQAEKLASAAVEATKISLGPEHNTTLFSMNTLASVYGKQGRWKEAEDLEMKVLEIRKTVMVPEHPDTLMSMNDLMVTYFYQDRMPEALTLGRECSRLRVAVLGPTHPDTVKSMKFLAVIEDRMREQGLWLDPSSNG